MDSSTSFSGDIATKNVEVYLGQPASISASTRCTRRSVEAAGECGATADSDSTPSAAAAASCEGGGAEEGPSNAAGREPVAAVAALWAAASSRVTKMRL